jgi:quercetin dioxygenase-like cupin family protein
VTVRISRADAAHTRAIREWNSVGVAMRTLAEYGHNEFARVTYGAYGAGAKLGRHPTGSWQAFAILDGAGWVEGDDEIRIDVLAGDVVIWEPGEEHASGSNTGMHVCIVQTSHDPGSAF